MMGAKAASSDLTLKVYGHRPTDQELARDCHYIGNVAMQRVTETPDLIKVETRSILFFIPIAWVMSGVPIVAMLTKNSDWDTMNVLEYVLCGVFLLFAITVPFLIREIDRKSMSQPDGFEWQRQRLKLLLTGHAESISANQLVEIFALRDRGVETYLLVCRHNDEYRILPLRAATSRKMRRAIKTIASEADAGFRVVSMRKPGA